MTLPLRPLPMWSAIDVGELDRCGRGTLTVMGTKADLVIWFQPVLGEPFTLESTEFESMEAALERLRQALEEGATMLFSTARPEREEGHSRTGPTLVNFTHVLAVRVWAGGADDDALYL